MLMAALEHQDKEIVVVMFLAVQEVLGVAVAHLLLVVIPHQTQMVMVAQELHHLFRVRQ